MNIRTYATYTLLIAFLACSKEVKIPPKVFEAAIARTTNLTIGEEANLNGFQRSLYFSPKTGRYYCVDFVAKSTFKDLIFISVYDETMEAFRSIEGGRLTGLTLSIDDESLKPQKVYKFLMVSQASQLKDSKP